VEQPFPHGAAPRRPVERSSCAAEEPHRSPTTLEAALTAPPSGSVYDEVQWHLSEIAKAVNREPAPLNPDLLRIILRGLAELCRLAYERGHEAPVVPPSLFRDSPAVSEALHTWEAHLRAALTARRRTTPGDTTTSSACAANSSGRTSAACS